MQGVWKVGLMLMKWEIAGNEQGVCAKESDGGDC